MKERELLERLARASRRPVPDVGALLERAFDEDVRERRPSGMPLAAAATVTLALGASAPAWLEAAPADRERSETLARAVAQAARVLSNELQARDRDED